MTATPKTIKKHEEKLRRLTGKALTDYAMISEGDSILVACSGGKDSTALLLLLSEIQRRSPLSFSLHPVMVDQKQPGFNPHQFKKWLGNQGIDLHIIEEDTYSIIIDRNDTNKKHCSLCARLRRGILYSYAAKNNVSKIALGHHRDDINETLLLNLFFEGTLATMPPVVHSDDGRNIVIRPLCNAPEKLIADYATLMDFPLVDCGACVVHQNKQRREIKDLLHKLSLKHPDISASMLAGLKNVKPSHLLDTNLFSF